MKVTRTAPHQFLLTRENEDDDTFLAMLDHERAIAPMQGVFAEPNPASEGRALTGYTLLLDGQSPQALRVKAASQALRSLGDLLRLGLREAADDRLVLALATNPQAQESIAAGVVQLQLVLQALGLEIIQHQPVGVVGSAHGKSSVNRTSHADAATGDAQ